MTYRFPGLYENGRNRLAVAIICLVMGQAVALGIGAYATRQIFAMLYSDVDTGNHIAFITLAVSSLVFGVCGVFAARISERLGHSFAISFRKNFYGKLSLIPASVLQKKRVGALAIRFVGDLGAMREWASKGITGCISALIITPVGLCVLWSFSPLYGITILFSVVVALGAMGLYAGRLRSSHTRMRRERANLSIDMMERVGIAPSIRTLGRTRADQKLLERRGEDLADASQKRASQRELLKCLPDIVLGLGGVTILFLTMQHDLPASQAAAGLAIVSIMSMPLRNLAHVWDIHCSWRIAHEKSLSIFNMKSVPKSAGIVTLPNGPLSVEIKEARVSGVSLHDADLASGGLMVLSGFEIDTTLFLNTIGGIERLESGQIKIGGVDLCKVKPRDLAHRTTKISMNTPILQGSFRRALTLGCKPRPQDEEILAAVKKFGLCALVERLGGLSGRVYENGRNLSDSEKIRMYFAGAHLVRPSLMLIDLPDALMDPETKDYVLNYLTESACTVVLTERARGLATVREAPVFVTIDKAENTNISQSTIETGEAA